MPESEELFAELRVIRSRIEGIEHTQEILVRAQSESIVPTLIQAFADDPVLARVFLLVDGSRTQQDIVAVMKANKHPGASDATVSRKIDLLHNDMALIDFVDQTGRGKVYRKSAVDRILRLSRKVESALDQR